jgi:hypothetical protein
MYGKNILGNEQTKIIPIRYGVIGVNTLGN